MLAEEAVWGANGPTDKTGSIIHHNLRCFVCEIAGAGHRWEYARSFLASPGVTNIISHPETKWISQNHQKMALVQHSHPKEANQNHDSSSIPSTDKIKGMRLSIERKFLAKHEHTMTSFHLAKHPVPLSKKKVVPLE